MRCHADSAPAGGWSAAGYSAAIGCGEDRVASVLDHADHATFVTANERARIRAWVGAGAPSVVPAVHPAGFANPRAPANHAALLRAALYRPLIDPNDADTCGTCHDAAGARPEAVRSPAPGAPACTTCHTAENGVQACGTCHGDGAARAYPPRDRCLFPDAKDDRAHATHIERGLTCAACHAAGAHQDGKVDVACTGSACHARGGAKPAPAWSDGPLGCNDCHRSPPEEHYQGACVSCHRVDARVHVNGKIDLGDGSGKCGACHGNGDDPRPPTGAHARHLFACETCHELPAGKHPLGGEVRMKLGALAARGGRRPAYDRATKTCAGTYCHEGSGATTPAPAWTGGPTTCTSCHGAPPPPPHPPQTDCASCHPIGGATHVDGALEFR